MSSLYLCIYVDSASGIGVEPISFSRLGESPLVGCLGSGSQPNDKLSVQILSYS